MIPDLIQEALYEEELLLNQTGKRILGLADVNVTRDIVEFEYIVNSDEEAEKLNYSV